MIWRVCTVQVRGTLGRFRVKTVGSLTNVGWLTLYLPGRLPSVSPSADWPVTEKALPI